MRLPCIATLLLALSVLGCQPHATETTPGVAPATGAAAPSGGSTEKGDPQAVFLAAFRQASERKDLEQMLQLYCWDSVDAEMKETVRGNVQDELQQPVTDLQFVEAEPGKHGPSVEGGIHWKPNLPVVAVVKARFAKSATAGLSVSEAKHALGMKDGQYKIVVRVRQP